MVAWSADDKRMITYPEDNDESLFLDVVNFTTGEKYDMFFSFFQHSTIEFTVFSSNGLHAASGFGNDIKVWNVEFGAQFFALTGHTGRVMCGAISPDDRQLVTGSRDTTLRVWDFQDHTEDDPVVTVLDGHMGTVCTVAFSPDGQIIASGSEDETLSLWNASSKVLIGILYGHLNRVSSVAFSPDGKLICSGSSDKTIRLWDVEKQETISILTGHTCRVRSVAFSPDGQRIVSGGDDSTLRVWDAKTGREVRSIENKNVVKFVKYTADGQYIIYHSGCVMKVLDMWKCDVFWSPSRSRHFTKNVQATIRTLLLGMRRLTFLTRVDPACLEMDILSGLCLADM